MIYQIVQEKWDRIKTHTKILKTAFTNLLKNCVKANFFSFNDVMYHQVHGMPMDSPLSPVLADLIMEKLLDFVIPLLSFDLIFLKKYVDDICKAVPADRIDETLTTFNSFNARLQFTVESEVNGCMPFLDMMLIRDHGG